MGEQANANVIVCAGIHRSASTWLVNIVAQLRQCPLIYDDTPIAMLDAQSAGARVAIKTHEMNEAALCHLRRFGYPLIITIRDPLDCVASYMRQLRLGFDDASSFALRSAACVLRLSRSCGHLLLRYERQARDAATIQQISAFIGADPPLSYKDAHDLAERLSLHSVRRIVEQLTDSGLFEDLHPAAAFDPATHWHPQHVGSGRSNTYDGFLDDTQIAVVRDRFAEFREQFGYV